MVVEVENKNDDDIKEDNEKIESHVCAPVNKKYENISPFQASEIIRLTERIDLDFEEFGSEHPITLTSINTLAEIYFETFQFEKAEYFFRRAFIGRGRCFGKHHILTFFSLTRLAYTLDKLRRFTESVECFNIALIGLDSTVCRCPFPNPSCWGCKHPDPIDILPTLEGLAHECHITEDLINAEKHYFRALKFRENNFPEEDPNTLVAVNKLAAVYMEQKKLDLALDLCNKTLIACTERLGELHPTTLECVRIVAHVLHGQGNLDEAEVLYKKALFHQVKLLGEHDVATLVTVCMLAQLYTVQCRFPQAEEMRRRSLATCQYAYGDDHPKTLAEFYHLGYILLEQEILQEGEICLRTSLNGRLIHLGKLNPLTLESQHMLAKLLAVWSQWHHHPGAVERTKECEEMFIICLAGRDEVFGEDDVLSMDTARCLAEFQIEYAHQRLAYAEKLYRRLYKSIIKKKGLGNIETASISYRFASVLNLRKKYAEAALIFIKAHESYTVNH